MRVRSGGLRRIYDRSRHARTLIAELCVVCMLCIGAFPAFAQYDQWRVLIPTPEDPRWVDLENEEFQITVGENIYDPDVDPEFIWWSPKSREWLGSGLLGWFHKDFPGRPIAQQFAGSGALNFEHIIGLLPSDSSRSSYTPRSEECVLEVLSDRSAALHWSGADSAWPFDASVIYRLTNLGIEIDLEVLALDSVDTPEVRFMFASYMNTTVGRNLYFGASPQNQFGTTEQIEGQGRRGGVVAGADSPSVRYLEGTYKLNIERMPDLAWTKPVWFGYVDGDGNYATYDPQLMIFASADSNVEILMWSWNPPFQGFNWPAWDWSKVIRGVEPGRSYSSKMLVAYVPAALRDDGSLDHEANWAKAEGIYDSWEPELPIDENPPVIRFKDQGLPDALLEISTETIDQDAEFDPLWLLDYVVDNEDGVLYSNGVMRDVDSISVTGLNTAVAGEQQLVFSAADFSGNQSQRTLNVEVLPTPDRLKPRLSMNGPSLVKLKKGEQWVDPGVVATDNRSASPNLSVKVTSAIGTTYPAVDTRGIGRWTIRYQATDEAGNKSKVLFRTVSISDPNFWTRFAELLRAYLDNLKSYVAYAAKIVQLD